MVWRVDLNPEEPLGRDGSIAATVRPTSINTLLLAGKTSVSTVGICIVAAQSVLTLLQKHIRGSMGTRMQLLAAVAQLL